MQTVLITMYDLSTTAALIFWTGEWRCASTVPGALFALRGLMMKMLKLCVGVLQDLVSVFFKYSLLQVIIFTMYI